MRGGGYARGSCESITRLPDRGHAYLDWRDKRIPLERHAGIARSKWALGSTEDKRVATMEVQGYAGSIPTAIVDKARAGRG